MNRRAFTLVELLVVVGIISLLVAALGVGIRNAQVSSRDSRRVSDVLSISKAIDQYALTNRGNYPVNVAGGNKSRMCVSDLLDTANTNGLDLSLLPGRSMPKDPRPATASASCTSYLNGYTYHTEFGQVNTSLATQKKVTYVLEVGLEGDNASDQTTIQATGTSDSGRSQFVLYGPSCGSACYK